jgi:hypothetical protein
MSVWLSKSSEVKPMGRTAAMMNLVKPKEDNVPEPLRFFGKG